MKKWVLLPFIVFLAAGCSKSTDESKSEELGREMSGKMRAPIEEARSITEKVQKTREMPPME